MIDETAEALLTALMAYFKQYKKSYPTASSLNGLVSLLWMDVYLAVDAYLAEHPEEVEDGSNN